MSLCGGCAPFAIESNDGLSWMMAMYDWMGDGIRYFAMALLINQQIEGSFIRLLLSLFLLYVRTCVCVRARSGIATG